MAYLVNPTFVSKHNMKNHIADSNFLAFLCRVDVLRTLNRIITGHAKRTETIVPGLGCKVIVLGCNGNIAKEAIGFG